MDQRVHTFHAGKSVAESQSDPRIGISPPFSDTLFEDDFRNAEKKDAKLRLVWVAARSLTSYTLPDHNIPVHFIAQYVQQDRHRS